MAKPPANSQADSRADSRADSKTRRISLLLLCIMACCPIAWAVDQVEIPLKNEAGKDIGTAKLKQMKHGVGIRIEAKGLAPGEHALHVHEKGVCQAPDFKSAGEHFSPQRKSHGFDASSGPHEGDMPNLIVAENGTGHMEVVNTHVSLGKGPNSLLRGGGTTLVIHSGPNNFKSQPAGNAGDRVACGEIREKKSG